MLSDPDRPTILMGMSGALIAGGLRTIIADMIKNGYVDVIVTTGAIAYQDLYQALGNSHYIGSPDADDEVLCNYQIDRIYDTYVDERKFRKTDILISKLVKDLDKRSYSTREFFSWLGTKIDDENSILFNASKFGVPIFCPAIADSSIGIGLTVHFHKNGNGRKKLSGIRNTGEENGVNRFHLDTIQDNYEIAQIISHSKKTAAIYLGGGVPKNYINDSVVMADMIFKNTKGHEYAIQITMDQPGWGGLSGSTLAEAQSWGKIDVEAKKASVNVELTIGLPLIYSYIHNKKRTNQRKRFVFKWEERGNLKAMNLQKGCLK
jgi:deoxyhypusine synthase